MIIKHKWLIIRNEIWAHKLFSASTINRSGTARHGNWMRIQPTTTKNGRRFVLYRSVAASDRWFSIGNERNANETERNITNSCVYQNERNYKLALKLNYHQFIFSCTPFRAAFFTIQRIHFCHFGWSIECPIRMPTIAFHLSQLALLFFSFIHCCTALLYGPYHATVCFVSFKIILIEKFNYSGW